MRIFSLLTGLFGLFALSLAAPTSKDITSLASFADVTTGASHEGCAKLDTVPTSGTPPSHASPAGDALLCSTDINTGPCSKVPANGQCTDITGAVDHNARTVYQNKGSVCEYFETNNCSDRLGHSDSTHSSIRVSVPVQVASHISSALCRSTTPHGAATDAESGAESATLFLQHTDVSGD